ncbi:MAG: hypothetical protein JWP89_3763 [Schlesneria sp.]|nr:hypothetical protein [Schlesneria sp.]
MVDSAESGGIVANCGGLSGLWAIKQLNPGRRYAAAPLHSALGWFIAAFQAFSERELRLITALAGLITRQHHFLGAPVGRPQAPGMFVAPWIPACAGMTENFETLKTQSLGEIGYMKKG